MSRCAFTLQARADLQQIHDYIARNSPSSALRFVVSEQMLADLSSINEGCPALASPPNKSLVNYKAVSGP